MGSVVIEDVGTDITRYPHSSMSDELHDRERARAERRHNAPPHRQASQSSAYPYSSARPAAPQLSYQSASSNFSGSTAQQSQRSASSRALEGALPSSRAATNSSIAANASSSSNAVQTPHHSGEESYTRPETANETDAPEAPVVSPPSPQLLPTVRSSLHLSQSSAGSPTRIKVRSLSHIHSFASEEVLAKSQHGMRRFELKRPEGTQYEISEMPVADIIEMVAGLLTKITTTNDRQHQHDHINRHMPAPEGNSALNQQTASVLSFHGKNVPSITILSYLSRIHKYCPTTYEVFLSLLVYFDRMTESINNGTLTSFQSAAQSAEREIMSPSSTTSFQAEMLQAQKSQAAGAATNSQQSVPIKSEPDAEEGPDGLANCFVVDSFNIHRLVIAGVTCASKFFSDVFYTNSRYAKVGGLPIHELNHLELQFLLLNDFRLSVPVEELEAYGSMLVEFYASEVVAQQVSQPESDDLYMRSSTPSASE